VIKWSDELPFKPDYIASHGHTIFHEPGSGFTTQIGSGAHIAFESGIDTITTFRTADVAAGGQGAPFAPASDQFLFPGYQGYLNLGGIANIHLQTKDGEWKAWDIGPCNQALNFLAEKTGHPFDKDGHLAAQGNVHPYVIQDLLAMFKYNHGQPKGLSNADVQLSWIHYLTQSTENVLDLLASTTEAIAQMVVHHIQPIIQTPSSLFITGGGAHNQLLMQLIESKTVVFGVTIHLPSKSIIDFKECLLMAYLGFLTLHNLPYPISHLTGASADTIGGALFKAKR
jgi:anhydro-N-acetylmuramic acid kinase